MDDDTESAEGEFPESDSLQAEQLREELAQQIALLQGEIANYKDALIAYNSNLMPAQVKRVEREMRQRLNELRHLTGLLAALDERFPRD